MAQNKTLVVEEERRDEEAEETLSLCDLPLYSDRSSDWEEDCSSSEENEYFEFSSQELISPVKSASLPENIIFCGKLIHYKQPDKVVLESSKELVHDESKKKKSLFTSIFTSRSSSKVHGSNSMNGAKSNRDNERKMSSVLTPMLSGKARWYLCMFGISSFNQEAALRDRKTRQKSRKQPLPPMFGFPTVAENGGNRSGDKGMWSLMRAISCGANHPTATLVAASMKEF